MSVWKLRRHLKRNTSIVKLLISFPSTSTSSLSFPSQASDFILPVAQVKIIGRRISVFCCFCIAHPPHLLSQTSLSSVSSKRFHTVTPSHQFLCCYLGQNQCHVWLYYCQNIPNIPPVSVPVSPQSVRPEVFFHRPLNQVISL